MPLLQRTQNFTDRRSRTPGTVMVKGRRCQDGDVVVTCVINHHFWTIASSMTRWQNLRNFDYLAAREGLVLIMVLTQMISAKFWTERKNLGPVELKIEVLTQFAPYFSFLMTLMTPCRRPAPFDIKRISQKIWPSFLVSYSNYESTTWCFGARARALHFWLL